MKRELPLKPVVLGLAALTGVFLLWLWLRRRQLDPPPGYVPPDALDVPAGPPPSTAPTPQHNPVKKPPPAAPDDADEWVPPPPIASLNALNAKFDPPDQFAAGGGGQSGGAGADRST